MNETSELRPSAPFEDPSTKAIEDQTTKVPSDAFLAVALGSMAVSALLMLRQRPEAATFVGQWAPALLVMGLYNKVVKLERGITELTA